MILISELGLLFTLGVSSAKGWNLESNESAITTAWRTSSLSNIFPGGPIMEIQNLLSIGHQKYS